MCHRHTHACARREKRKRWLSSSFVPLEDQSNTGRQTHNVFFFCSRRMTPIVHHTSSFASLNNMKERKRTRGREERPQLWHTTRYTRRKEEEEKESKSFSFALSLSLSHFSLFLFHIDSIINDAVVVNTQVSLSIFDLMSLLFDWNLLNKWLSTSTIESRCWTRSHVILSLRWRQTRAGKDRSSFFLFVVYLQINKHSLICLKCIFIKIEFVCSLLIIKLLADVPDE